MTTEEGQFLWISGGGSHRQLLQQLSDIGRKDIDYNLLPRPEFMLRVYNELAHKRHPSNPIKIGVLVSGVRLHRNSSDRSPHLWVFWATIPDHYVTETPWLEPFKSFEAYYDIGNNEGKLYRPRS